VHITYYKVTGVHSHKKVGKEIFLSFLKKTDNFMPDPADACHPGYRLWTDSNSAPIINNYIS
jgi:hypothetical protein